MTITTFDTNQYIFFLLVFTRVSGAVLFNPFFGRRSIPAIVKVGLSAAIALCISPALWGDSGFSFSPSSFIVFGLIVIKELFVGFFMGFIMQLIMSAALIAGEAADLQIGLGMGKVYDPQSNATMAITGTLYNLFFTLVFFLSNGHLTLIRMAADSFKLFPAGKGVINFGGAGYAAALFGDVLVIAVKLALPVIAIMLLTEAGLGFMMRAVPHLNIFAVGLQIKLAVGLAVLIASLPAVSKLLDSTITFMFGQMAQGINRLIA